MAKPNLKVLDGGKAAPTPRKKRRRKVVETSAMRDPNVKALNRTFEITMHYVTGEHVVEKKVRIRVPKDGLEDNVYEVGDKSAYFGMISEHINGKKWTPYGFGHIFMQDDYIIREVHPGLEKEDAPKIGETNKDDKK